MNKTLRIFIIITLLFLSIFVVFVSFAHFYERVLGNSTSKLFKIIDFYIPVISGLIAGVLTVPSVLFLYRATLPKYRKLFFSLFLIFFSALCITFTGNIIAYETSDLRGNNSSYDMYMNNIVRPKVVTAFVLLFLILSIACLILFFSIKTIPPRRPTKAERAQAQIDELQKQIDELKKGE